VVRLVVHVDLAVGSDQQRRGIAAAGPLAADGVFGLALADGYDAIVCMYHDQGLAPFKLLHFADGVNVTLGLPFVRTSPDHGTAYDIAGGGAANGASMLAAMEYAWRAANGVTRDGRDGAAAAKRARKG